MTAVKWGLVGFGEQAKRMVGSLKKLKDVEIAGVCCSSEERGQEAKEFLGVRAYGKFADFLSDPEIQVVYIATPHHLHTPQAFKAVEAGKNVLVEKPMALSMDGAHKLIDAAGKKKVILGVNFALRQHPGLQEIKRDIQDKCLGNIIQIHAHLSRSTCQGEGWRGDQFHSGPMCLMDLGVQGIDLAVWFTGERAQEVAVIGRGGRDDHTLNVSAMVSIYFPSGAQAAVSCSNMSGGAGNFIAVRGSEKQVLVEMNWPEGDGSVRIRKAQSGREEEKRYDPMDLCMVTAQNFNSAVQGQMTFSPCCVETYPVVEATCAAIESLKGGRSIRAGQVLRVFGMRF